MKNNYLRAQSCLVMENTFNKITEFLGSDLTLTPDAYTAGVADHLADHVLRLARGRVRVFLPLATYWPLGDVIRPHVRSNARRGLAETESSEEYRQQSTR